MAANFEIIIGTYEQFLLGYKLNIKDEKKVLAQSFADQSHYGPIKCAAVMGRWVATGGADDRIFIYDMSCRKQSQILLSHEATINALAFTSDETHLLSGGADGCMIATRLKTWVTEAIWKKAHKGQSVTHIACHPSGKMALSLGTDLVLRTWNLVKGRVAYKISLKSRRDTLGCLPDCLAFSPTGDYFTLTGPRTVEIWSIKMGNLLIAANTEAKPICLSWVGNETCVVGMENGKLHWVDINAGEEEDTVIVAHATRVKAMSSLSETLMTISSTGELKMWQVNVSNKRLKEMATINIGCRPTCMELLDLNQFPVGYSVSNQIEKHTEISHATEQKPKKQQRGMVSVEYENDDDDDDDTKNKGTPKKNKFKTVSGEEDNEEDTDESDETDEMDQDCEEIEDEEEGNSIGEEEIEGDSVAEEEEDDMNIQNDELVKSKVLLPKSLKRQTKSKNQQVSKRAKQDSRGKIVNSREHRKSEANKKF